MSRKAELPASRVEPFVHPLKTRDIQVLWMLRILAHCGHKQDFFSHPKFRGLREMLGIPQAKTSRRSRDFDEEDEDEEDEGEDALLYARLLETLKQLERRRKQVLLPQPLRLNLQLLRQRFSFNRAECMALALAVCLRNNQSLFDVADASSRSVNAPATVAKVLGVSAACMSKALGPGSRLRRSNLVNVSSGGDLAMSLQLARGGMRKLGLRKLKDVDEMLDGIVDVPPAPKLLPEDYAHLQPGFADVQRLLSDAFRHRRNGVNVLLYGPPGTGKTELVRVLARQLGVPLYDVAGLDGDGDSMTGRKRLPAAAAAQFVLGKRKAVLCFDEVEFIFNDGSDFFGKPSTAEEQKGAFNHMLESNGVPTFWIANSIRGIDPAFVRRFDLVLRLEVPPQKQRLQLLERECGQLVAPAQLQRLSRLECITPAVVTRASSVVRRMAPRNAKDSGKLLETVLDGVLQAQRHPSLRTALRNASAEGFDPALSNASEDLAELAAGVAKSGMGRICLYGVPGTGKTAFGHWLAEQLGKPLLLKRVSDLQSPFLGVMEQNLARAFDQAKRDDAVLQIDEVDSFLQDRRNAQRSWGISQVNEFLTQIESYEGIFIASTNLMDNIDQAALRRFDYKVRMDYLRHEQAAAMLRRHLDAWGMPALELAITRLPALKLVPGDFAVVARRHKVSPFADVESVVGALCAEAAMRQPTARNIGFV